MTDIPYDIAFDERDALMAGIAERLDSEELRGELSEQVNSLADDVAERILEELEAAIEDSVLLNVADSVRAQAERMATELLERVMLGDEEAFLHLIGSDSWLRRGGRERFPFDSSLKFREAILNKHRHLFVSEIIADCEARVAYAEARSWS
jgi:hypothetical protein